MLTRSYAPSRTSAFKRHNIAHPSRQSHRTPIVSAFVATDRALRPPNAPATIVASMRTPSQSLRPLPPHSRLHASLTRSRSTSHLLILLAILFLSATQLPAKPPSRAPNTSAEAAPAVAQPPSSVRPSHAVAAERNPRSFTRFSVHRAGFWTAAAPTGLGLLSLLAVPRRRGAIPALLAVLFVFCLVQHRLGGPATFWPCRGLTS